MVFSLPIYCQAAGECGLQEKTRSTGLLPSPLFIFQDLLTRYAVSFTGPGTQVQHLAPFGAEGPEGVSFPFCLFPADGACNNHRKPFLSRMIPFPVTPVIFAG
jgi:hypothetical protein